MKTKYYCKDCKKEISIGHERCCSCARKYQYKMHPETNPMFKGLEVKKCELCGHELAKSSKYSNGKRCVSCRRIGIKQTLATKQKISEILKNKNLIGELAYAWKGGKPKCKICQKRVHNFYAELCIECYTNLRKQIPEINPTWENGASYLPYPPLFNSYLKELIRKRDNYICQNCGMTEEEHLMVYGNNITIHHIDYIKENCEENNLISLCYSCNSRANFNKSYWQEFYSNKIKV
jgi:hypothetical protein